MLQRLQVRTESVPRRGSGNTMNLFVVTWDISLEGTQNIVFEYQVQSNEVTLMKISRDMCFFLLIIGHPVSPKSLST